jgi:hypothetical protein
VTTHHPLKSWPEFFEAVLTGKKRFEWRDERDRTFTVGDVLDLHEWVPPYRESTMDGNPRFTGRRLRVEVVYLMRGAGLFGMPHGFVILGLGEPTAVVRA